MLRALLLIALAACGRVSFDDASQPDASMSGDGVIDPDVDAFVAVCGDGICSGNAGELCSQCADCNTAALVCGNGECQAGEDGTSCYADCGPAPWPWTQDEADLLTAINAARTGGTYCPGDSMPRFAAAVSADTTMRPGAREYAWELAHEQYSMGNGASCNGRTFGERQQTYGANGGLSLYTNPGVFPSPADVVDVWRTNTMLCPFLMSTTSTLCATAVARDGWDSYVMWMK